MEVAVDRGVEEGVSGELRIPEMDLDSKPMSKEVTGVGAGDAEMAVENSEDRIEGFVLSNKGAVVKAGVIGVIVECFLKILATLLVVAEKGKLVCLLFQASFCKTGISGLEDVTEGINVVMLVKMCLGVSTLVFRRLVRVGIVDVT